VGNVGLTELILIIVILILLFGSRRIPELFKSLGTSIRQFKKGMQDDDSNEPPKS
jgi:sec-independent protein translocase protein TatA